MGRWVKCTGLRESYRLGTRWEMGDGRWEMAGEDFGNGGLPCYDYAAWIWQHKANLLFASGIQEITGLRVLFLPSWLAIHPSIHRHKTANRQINEVFLPHFSPAFKLLPQPPSPHSLHARKTDYTGLKNTLKRPNIPLVHREPI